MMRAFALFLITVAFAAPLFANDSPSALRTHITTSSGKRITLQLELAITPQARERGLMGRKTLKPHDGMAFFFPHITPQKFWMKDTLIPLDVLFVDASNRIIAVEYGAPNSLTAFGPDAPVSSVIEIAGGRAKTQGIAVGDVVHYEIATTPQNLAR